MQKSGELLSPVLFVLAQTQYAVLFSAVLLLTAQHEVNSKSIPSTLMIYSTGTATLNKLYWYFYVEGGKVSMMVFKSDNHTLIGTAKYGISLFTQAGLME